MSNGFASADDPQALQEICDRLGPGTLAVFFQRWLARLPLPLTPTDRDAGYWWELSMAQLEVSRTVIFTQPRYARGFFEALVTGNLGLGRPDTIEILFDRQIRTGSQRATGGEFKTTVVTRGTEVTINAPNDLGCQRRLHNLDEILLDCDVLIIPGADLHMVTYTAAAGTSDAGKLDLLRVTGGRTATALP